jgi:hypothetical protein
MDQETYEFFESLGTADQPPEIILGNIKRTCIAKIDPKEYILYQIKDAEGYPKYVALYKAVLRLLLDERFRQEYFHSVYTHGYQIDITFSNWKGLPMFHIYAIDMHSGRNSKVNTMNAILSYFEIEDQYRQENSDWLISPEEYEKFLDLIVEMTTSDLSWLSDALDEDRREGEWESLAEKAGA